MSNICAGIGRGQMFVLDEHIARRRAIHSLYVDLLKDVAGITVMENPDSRFASNFWLTCILVDPKLAGKSREDIRLRLDSENIETRPHVEADASSACVHGCSVLWEWYE